MLKLLSNAEVFAPEPLGQKNLLVAAGKIVWMGSSPPSPLPSSIEIEETDLTGHRLIPGLIDCHAHLTGGGGEAGFKSRVPPLGVSQFTRAGTTTVVGVLGTDDITRGTAGLVAAARGLREEGLSAFCLTGGYHVPPVTLTGSVRDDIVHVDPIIGVGEIAISDHRSSQPTRDELLRIAAEAHVAGMLSGKAGLVHLHLGDGDRGLKMIEEALDQTELPARVFHPTHVNRKKKLFEQALGMTKRGVTVDVTAFPVEEGEDAWSAEDAVERFVRADLSPHRLTVSSDAGGSLPCFDREGQLVHYDVAHPQAVGHCLQKLLSRGLPLEVVLPFFTSNVAEQFRFEHKGRIRVGADADLVALDAKAFPGHVMCAGEWHVRSGILARKGMFEKDKTNSSGAHRE